MTADLEPTDARANDVAATAHPTEPQRALRAALLGAALGAILVALSRRRTAR